jgi:hypothetical protein
MTNNIRDYDPAKGCAFQGDVAIVPVPAGITIDTADEIKAINGRLILQEGEVTGHHHAIHLPAPVMFRDDALARAEPVKTDDAVLAKHFGEAKHGTAKMYRDRNAAEAMVRSGILERSDLLVGFLKVEGGPVVVRHEEHDAIRLPEGTYYIGRQVESAGAEERVVAD